ncbi:MAG: hypothetical protein WC030_03715 [Candidatus Paceibacterota bacterium]
MQLISQRIFTVELKRLKQLALMATYSFDQTSKALIDETRKPEFNKDLKIVLSKSSGDSAETYQILRRLKSQAPRYLQELLFTRSISALEVFLIDSIRELERVVPEKLKTQGPISYTREQILSFASMDDLQRSLIDQDCRQLSSGGFQEITTFYRSKFQIDYRSLHPGINVLNEYHDRRHLLVHKLGQVDDGYRHRYSSTAKLLSVDMPYLIEVIDNLLIFSEELNTKIAKELFGIKSPPAPGMSRNLYVFDIKDSDTLPDCLKPAYQVRRGANAVSLSSLLLNSSIQHGRFRTVLEGDVEVMDLYAKAIYRAHVTGKLKVRFANPKKLHKLFFPNKNRDKWIQAAPHDTQ